MISLNLYKKKGHYYAEAYDPDRHPRRKYRTLRTRDRRVAMQKLAALEGELARGDWDPWDEQVKEDGLFVREATQRFLLARTDRRPKTRQADESTLRLFTEGLKPGFMLGHIERHHVARFLERLREQGRSSATLRTYDARLRRFFGWCVEEGLLRAHPMQKLKRPKLRKKEKVCATESQVDLICRAIEAHATMLETGLVKQGSLQDGAVLWLREVVVFAFETGLRLSEIVNLRWRWIDQERRRIVVGRGGDFITKSGHERVVPVRGRAWETLEQLREGRPSEDDDAFVFTGYGGEQLDGTYLSKRFTTFRRMARLPEGLSFHSLRHGYITRLIEEGVPLPVVQKLAGHADIKTTMGYAHVGDGHLDAAVERVFG